MVASLPEELLIPNVAHKVALEEYRKAVDTVLRGVDILLKVLLILTGLHALVVVVRHIAVEAVEVHRLVVSDGECR